MLAVIKTGGKQYLVKPGQRIKIEKLPQKEGEEVLFENVLLAKNDENITIGTPNIEGATVKGKILRHGKAEKVIVFKFKAKKREKKKKGYRQLFTEVEITAIEAK
ncbi:MAG: 50S ribosomal protein L21 [Candidatus Wildermuthbacteria bacterium]|nr:50S ribosomal protein L21 [Candidatus Wildermuthbacteria bacterium]